MSCVFGYTVGKRRQRTHLAEGRSRPVAGQERRYFSKPMGPWIETDVDLESMETIVRVNGKESNRFRTNDMIFGIQPFVVELTKYFTLWAART